MIAWTIDDAGIARLTLDRPAARNAIAIVDWQTMEAAAQAIDRSDARVVILASTTPSIFSAGADLVEMARLVEEAERRPLFREAMRRGIEAVARLQMPVIAAIDGGCYGAGVALALAADLRIAGDAAVFATTPAKLGIGYPGEDVARLIARIGQGQAARMLLAAAPIDADEAHRIGLAEIRADDAGEAAAALARQIVALPTSAVRLLKATLADPGADDRDARFDRAFDGRDFAEQLAAFRHRRR